MKLTIFAKKRTTKDGRPFYNYLTTLTKKDGEEVTMQVKFRDDCGQPKGENCPMNIVVEKTSCNYSEKIRTYEDKDGNKEKTIDKVLWINAWTEGEPYVDTSMDEFVD